MMLWKPDLCVVLTQSKIVSPASLLAIHPATEAERFCDLYASLVEFSIVAFDVLPLLQVAETERARKIMKASSVAKVPSEWTRLSKLAEQVDVKLFIVINSRQESRFEGPFRSVLIHLNANLKTQLNAPKHTELGMGFSNAQTRFLQIK